MKLHALLMAAGCSSRFGALKQLAEVDGQPMVARSFAVYESVFANQVSLVVGYQRSTVAQLVPESANIIYAPRWQQGLGASISCAVEQLPAETTHLLIGLSDQVAVDSAALQQLVANARQNPSDIVAAFYQGQAGVPAIFPRRYFPDLQQLNQDRGAKSILLQQKHNLKTVELPSAGIDIDTQEQLACWSN